MMRSGLTLERELRELLGTGRNALITARYYGFDGRSGGTLQTVGNEIGVTRERVRQIVTNATQWFNSRRPVAPMLDRTIAFVAHRMPASAEDIEAELQAQGLTSGLFRLEGVIKAAELFGRRLPFTITELHGRRLVHTRDVPLAKMIVRIARRLISRGGLTTVSNVVTQLQEFESVACDRKFVVSALTCLKDFHWLDQSSEWFWLSNSHNRVLNRIRKILSVANPIHMSQLMAGIGRDYVMGPLPPKRLILEFCRQAPGLHVHDESVRAEPAINADDVLTKAEKDIVRILSEHGGTMTRSELASACLQVGVNRRSFYHNLVFSPIFLRHRVGLYGLIQPGDRTENNGCFNEKSHGGTGSIASPKRNRFDALGGSFKNTKAFPLSLSQH